MTDTLQTGVEQEFNPSLLEVKANEVNKDKLWQKIYDSTKASLNISHTVSLKKEIKIYSDRITFACIYCGDSHSDEKKKRGNIFSTTWKYHCFNCGKHNSVYNFLKSEDHLEDYTIEERNFLKENASSYTTDLKALKHFNGLEAMFSEEILSLSIERDYFMRKKNLVEIKGTRMEKYLHSRLQESYDKFAFDPKKGNLYIFNLNLEGDRIISFQKKTFNKAAPYLSYKATGMYKYLDLYTEELAPSLAKLDLLSYCFGIFHVNLNKVITIFEGPLDSFLFPNAVATISANNDIPFEIESIRYFYDNDDRGRQGSLEKINAGKSVFLWRKYITDNEPFLSYSKIKDLNDLLLFARARRIKLKPFAPYFSNNKYDAIWI